MFPLVWIIKYYETIQSNYDISLFGTNGVVYYNALHCSQFLPLPSGFLMFSGIMERSRRLLESIEIDENIGTKWAKVRSFVLKIYS